MDNKGQMVTIFFSLFLILAVITILGIESANLNTNENVNSLIQAYNMPKLQYYFFLNTLSNVNSLTISNSTYGIVYSTLQKVYLNELQNINVSAVSLNTSNIVMQLPKKPTNIISYIPVTIFNLQNQATPYPFQQMVNANYSVYGNYSNAELSNIEFFYFNGTVIPSWLESNTGQYAVWWIKVGSIPASSSFTVYMGFARKNVSLFNKVTIGEAPELSPGYGEYDDGANVFYAYFNANTPKSDFNLNSAISFSTTTYKGTKAIQLTGVTDTRNGVMTYEKPLPNQAYLEFAYFAAPSTSDNNAEPSVGLGNSETATSINYYDGDAPSSTGSFSVQGFSDGSWSDNSVGTGTTQWQIDNFTYVPASSNVNGCEISPQVYCDTYTNELTSQSTLYLSFFYADADGVQLDALYNWVFVSSYPPNGIMPTVGFGSDLP